MSTLQPEDTQQLESTRQGAVTEVCCLVCLFNRTGVVLIYFFVLVCTNSNRAGERDKKRERVCVWEREWGGEKECAWLKTNSITQWTESPKSPYYGIWNERTCQPCATFCVAICHANKHSYHYDVTEIVQDRSRTEPSSHAGYRANTKPRFAKADY